MESRGSNSGNNLKNQKLKRIFGYYLGSINSEREGNEGEDDNHREGSRHRTGILRLLPELDYQYRRMISWSIVHLPINSNSLNSRPPTSLEN